MSEPPNSVCFYCGEKCGSEKACEKHFKTCEKLKEIEHKGKGIFLQDGRMETVYHAIDHFVKFGIGSRRNHLNYILPMATGWGVHNEEEKKKIEEGKNEQLNMLTDMEKTLISVQKEMEKIEPRLKSLRTKTKSPEIKIGKEA